MVSWWYESRDLGQLAPSDNCFKPQLAQNNIVLLFFCVFVLFLIIDRELPMDQQVLSL